MNELIVDVKLWGKNVGSLYWDKENGAAVFDYENRFLRSGQVQAPEGFGYWLLKFDGGIYSEHAEVSDNPCGIGNIEYAYYLMAKDCGIDMMECRLLVCSCAL